MVAPMIEEIRKGIEFAIRRTSTDRTLWWQRPDAATQSPVDSREVQILSSRDRTRPITTNRTQPESGRSLDLLLRLTGCRNAI